MAPENIYRQKKKINDCRIWLVGIQESIILFFQIFCIFEIFHLKRIRRPQNTQTFLHTHMCTHTHTSSTIRPLLTSSSAHHQCGHHPLPPGPAPSLVALPPPWCPYYLFSITATTVILQITALELPMAPVSLSRKAGVCEVALRAPHTRGPTSSTTSQFLSPSPTVLQPHSERPCPRAFALPIYSAHNALLPVIHMACFLAQGEPHLI